MNDACNTHPFDILELPQGGRLVFTPCPGTKGVDLQTSVAQLCQTGADAVITMMSNDELASFDVSALPDTVRESGMQWFQFPVEDDAAPDETFQVAWDARKAEVFSLLDRGSTVAIHCRGGSGRTGFMAAIIMIERGMGFAEAEALVKSLRPNSLKLPAHIEYLATHYPGDQAERSPA